MGALYDHENSTYSSGSHFPSIIHSLSIYSFTLSNSQIDGIIFDDIDHLCGYYILVASDYDSIFASPDNDTITTNVDGTTY